MTITPAYRTLFRLYPADYRTRFAAEMLSTFEANAKWLPQESLRSVHFAIAELLGLLIGVTTEWVAKLSTDVSVRGRCLPDLRMMRPPGVTKELWFARACSTCKIRALK